MTLHDALGNTSARLSPFACRVLTAHIFHACLEHSFTQYAHDEDAEFWKRQQNLDSRLAVLFMVLPDTMRCPEQNPVRHDAILVNLTLHTASICLHRVGHFRSAKWGQPSAEHAPGPTQFGAPEVRLLASAQAIFAIINNLHDPHLGFSNLFVAFAAFVAALVFLDNFATTHDLESEERLNTLMNLMIVMADQNHMTASLVLQLAGHVNKSGIDPLALDKVMCPGRHLDLI